jgi:DMSO/TMAO reductase YedYZ molybdopterin-dependent catalytic subunit
LRYLLDVPMPAELFAEQATVRIPLPLFEALLTSFGPAAKHLYLIGALVAEAVLMFFAGLAYVALRLWLAERLTKRPATWELSWWDVPGLVIWLYLLSAGFLAPLLGGAFLGVAMIGGAGVTLYTQLAPDVVFSGTLVWQMRALRHEHAAQETPQQTPDTPSEASPEAVSPEAVSPEAASPGTPVEVAPFSRRLFIQQSATAAGLLAVGIGLWEALTSGLGAALGAGPLRGSSPALSLGPVPKQLTPPPTPVYGAWAPVAGQTAELTSASDFYYVSKNLISDPSVSAGSWSLSITGLVDKAYKLTYDQLRALPNVSQYHTLECISNEVGGSLISNGLFVGVRLADVLNAAGIQAGANTLTFYAADGYSDSLHLAQALDERSLIVYHLDGAPLPQAHGFPARLLIPGLYGMKNGKWLTQLDVGNMAYTGYWEQRGWTSVAKVKLMSRIDTPHDGDLIVAQPTSIAGIAYSGADGIARVDVSVDAGRSWNTANLRRPLGALSWTLWEYPWLPETGQYVIAVRAIDLAGRVQQPDIAPPLPDGSSGYHAIEVTIR